MKVNYSIDKHRRLIVTTAEGSVMFDDIKGHRDRLLVDLDFDASFDQLIDTTPASDVDISADEARILASRRVLSSKSLRAFVATKPHILGWGRMMQVFHEDQGPAPVFYSMNETLNWLESRGETEEIPPSQFLVTAYGCGKGNN